MVMYAPIGDLVKQIPAEAWTSLAEIYRRRKPIMLGELLAEHKRASPPERRQPRSLANHPDNPGVR